MITIHNILCTIIGVFGVSFLASAFSSMAFSLADFFGSATTKVTAKKNITEPMMPTQAALNMFSPLPEMNGINSSAPRPAPTIMFSMTMP